MYSKSNVLLFIAYTVCAGLLVFSSRYEVQAESVDEQVTATVTAMAERVELERLESLERVITYNTLKPRFCIEVSEKDLETLMKIV